jgi:pimeloyl-ACP methyl ester carboxylesterase
LKYLRETDLRARLEAASPVKIPAAVFPAERDGIVRAANTDYLAGVFERAKLVKVPGTEHALPIEIPELIDGAVAFFREVAD